MPMTHNDGIRLTTRAGFRWRFRYKTQAMMEHAVAAMGYAEITPKTTTAERFTPASNNMADIAQNVNQSVKNRP